MQCVMCVFFEYPYFARMWLRRVALSGNAVPYFVRDLLIRYEALGGDLAATMLHGMQA